MDIRYSLVLTDVAEQDLYDIFEYISQKLSNNIAANALMNKIEKSFLNIEENPYLYEKVNVKLNNEIYRRLIVDNYIALYDIDENTKRVIVYRVLYSGRDYLENIE